jgi:sec-independent protein translocase protein TatC
MTIPESLPPPVQAINPQAINPQAINLQANNPEANNPEANSPQASSSQAMNPPPVSPDEPLTGAGGSAEVAVAEVAGVAEVAVAAMERLPTGLASDPDSFPGEVEMTLVDHLEELRRRILRSLLALVVAAAACLAFVRPLVRLLELPAGDIRFLQLAPGEFLAVSLKVAGYGGLTLALPYMLYEALAFVLPGLSRRERRLVAPAVAASALLFAAGLVFAWWALVPAALNFLVSYGADVVEPMWSIERYLDFVLLLMVATALSFQLPVLQLILGALGLIRARTMGAAWRWVLLGAAVASAVLTPSTDPLTMLLLAGAIMALYLVGLALVGLTERLRPAAD